MSQPSGSGGRIPKPKLRGYAHAYTIRHLTIAIVLSLGAGLAWKFGVGEPRKRKYAEFYR